MIITETIVSQVMSRGSALDEDLEDCEDGSAGFWIASDVKVECSYAE